MPKIVIELSQQEYVRLGKPVLEELLDDCAEAVAEAVGGVMKVSPLTVEVEGQVRPWLIARNTSKMRFVPQFTIGGPKGYPIELAIPLAAALASQLQRCIHVSGILKPGEYAVVPEPNYFGGYWEVIKA